MIKLILSLDNEHLFKISKVQDCKLKKVDDLPFDFYRGGCNTFDFGIMLCFSESATKECHS